VEILLLFSKTQNPCQDSQYFTRRIPARKKGVSGIFSVCPMEKISLTMRRASHQDNFKKNKKRGVFTTKQPREGRDVSSQPDGLLDMKMQICEQLSAQRSSKAASFLAKKTAGPFPGFSQGTAGLHSRGQAMTEGIILGEIMAELLEAAQPPLRQEVFPNELQEQAMLYGQARFADIPCCPLFFNP
jgi:hypothetical protein